MKTNHSIKAIMAMIVLMVVANCQTAQALSSQNNSALENLEIKPINEKLQNKKPSSLKLEINIDELRQIKIARKKALELQKQQEEEKRQEEARQAEQKKQEEAENQKVNQTVSSASTSNISYDELVAKLNRSLNSTLAGQGDTFAKYATELGLDPYLAVAIVLHETGCKWSCSTLLKQCNNVGGMKGSPGCNGGSYQAFPTLDEGIKAYMNNLYNNYYSKGLTTPEAMGPKYAASTTWATQVRAYMNELKAN